MKNKKFYFLFFVCIFFPVILLIRFEMQGNGTTDSYGRLVSAPNKKSTTCPLQTENTAIILAVGQSNSANHADNKFVTKYPGRVFNFFNGKCYVASSPLLGSSGMRGEFLTPMADILIDSGHYDAVVIVPSAVGNSNISRWNAQGDLGLMLINVLKSVNKSYQITSTIWHQGERDFLDKTNEIVYQNNFSLFSQLLRNNGVNAPLFIAISTYCGNPFRWKPENPIALTQAALIDNQKVFFGVNSDTILNLHDRALLNPCHFNKKGQLKVAASYADAIIGNKFTYK